MALFTILDPYLYNFIVAFCAAHCNHRPTPIEPTAKLGNALNKVEMSLWTAKHGRRHRWDVVDVVLANALINIKIRRNVVQHAPLAALRQRN